MKPFGFLREVARMALGDLRAYPLRSALSVASFSSGIAIAVLLVATGDGLRGAIAEILRSLGEGQIVVTPGRTTGLGGQRRAGRSVRIRYADVPAVREATPSLEGLAPYFDLRGGGAASWRYSIPYSPVRAVAREYQDVRRMPVSEGRWFTEDEDEGGRWVAVLNEGLRKIVFPESPAVGEWVQWRGRKMTVVGVVRDEALFPYILFVPCKTVSQMADTRYISGLVARPAAGESWETATSQLRRALGGLGEFDPADPNALEVEDNREFTARVRTVTVALHALVITIAAVCLLLGGLGVANMMVIAVTERTREIGLRKALGATPGGIFLQVLCEALGIILAGGAVGIALGAAACGALGALAISETYAAEIRFDPQAAAISVASLAVVGILAAAIPARRAAALPAAEALRWE
jgi:putative ABC transport system permease protein